MPEVLADRDGRLYVRSTSIRSVPCMFTFAVGLMIGLALGLVVIGFLAIGSYDRGRDAESIRRWRVLHAA